MVSLRIRWISLRIRSGFVENSLGFIENPLRYVYFGEVPKGVCLAIGSLSVLITLNSLSNAL